MFNGGFCTPEMLDILNPEDVLADAIGHELEFCASDETALIDALAEHLSAPSDALGQALLDRDHAEIGRLVLTGIDHELPGIAKSRVQEGMK